MHKKKYISILMILVLAMGLLTVSLVFAQGGDLDESDFDCAAYENYAGLIIHSY